MSDEEDIMSSILGELTSPPRRPRIESMEQSPEEREARGRATMAVILGDKLGLGRALSDDELKVALAIQERQKLNRAQLVGGGGNTRQMIVDDGGVGLGQIINAKEDSNLIDPVDAYLVDKARAGIEAGGDEFRTRMAMQRQEQVVLEKEAPFSRVAPVSISGAMLGNTVALRAGQEVLVARWEGPDADTRAVTITLGPVNTTRPGVAGSPAYRPYAVLKWGTSGYILTAEIDYCSGGQFTVNGSSVLVIAGLASNIAASSAPLNLSAMISFQPCVRTQDITRTTIDASIATGGGTSGVNRIPSFAKSFTIWRYDATNTTGGGQINAVVHLYDYALNEIAQINRAADSGSAESTMIPVPLPNDAQYYSVTNLDVDQLLTARVIWNLEF